jgi:thioester reductase-like protein
MPFEKVLITGAGGQLGRYTVAELLYSTAAPAE